MITEGFLNNLIDAFLLGVPFVLLIGGFLRNFRYSSRKRMEQLENQIEDLQDEVVVVTGSSVPGKIITRVVGTVAGFSTVFSYEEGEFGQAEREAMLALIRKARDEGANGVIDLKIRTGSSEQSEVEGMSPKVTYVGTAVVM